MDDGSLLERRICESITSTINRLVQSRAVNRQAGTKRVEGVKRDLL